MKRPLKQILTLTRAQWDNDIGRPHVRKEFQKVVDCRTMALGAEVFASDSGEEKIVPHTCKSRVCPSCGHMNTLQWLRERWSDLPDIPYSHVTLTMPDHFWPIFQANRHLLNDLPSLGAKVIERWVKMKYGATPMLAVIPHTFGRDLKFNCHLHILMSEGGLSQQSTRWVPDVQLEMRAIMRVWKYALITYLRTAYRKELVSTELKRNAFFKLLDEQYQRWWHVDCRRKRNKGQILRYAGRYARRPPVAEHRFLQADSQGVRFLTKDLKSKSTVETFYAPEEFIYRLSHHVPDRYANNIRYFGLLAPRTKGRLYDFIFFLLEQQRRSKPRRLPWALSLKKHFGVDPLVDGKGHPMQWTGRLAPQS